MVPECQGFPACIRHGRCRQRAPSHQGCGRSKNRCKVSQAAGHLKWSAWNIFSVTSRRERARRAQHTEAVAPGDTKAPWAWWQTPRQSPATLWWSQQLTKHRQGNTILRGFILAQIETPFLLIRYHMSSPNWQSLSMRQMAATGSTVCLASFDKNACVCAYVSTGLFSTAKRSSDTESPIS